MLREVSQSLTTVWAALTGTIGHVHPHFMVPLLATVLVREVEEEGPFGLVGSSAKLTLPFTALSLSVEP